MNQIKIFKPNQGSKEYSQDSFKQLSSKFNVKINRNKLGKLIKDQLKLSHNLPEILIYRMKEGLPFKIQFIKILFKLISKKYKLINYLINIKIFKIPIIQNEINRF